MTTSATALSRFSAAFAECPLIAILRGVEPTQCVDITQALYYAGFRIVEVPLNSPRPCESIERLARRFGGRMLVGAGTVLSTEDVRAVRDAGGQLIVAPNLNLDVVARSVSLGLACIPGIATPSEAFSALDQGATALKVFPAEGVPPKVLKAWRAVLPPRVKLIPVGGIDPDSMAGYYANGANGFGIGSALYKPDLDAAAVAERARAFIEAWQALR